MDIKDANEWIVTSPCVHAPMETQCIDYVSVGAPVTHDVSSHRALKIQQNYDIWVLIDMFKDALQMNFYYINKFTGLTNKINKVGNHKNSNFVQNKLERLWPLLLWIKYSK